MLSQSSFIQGSDIIFASVTVQIIYRIFLVLTDFVVPEK